MQLTELTSLTRLELEALQRALPTMTAQEKGELLADLEVRENRARLQAAKLSPLGFAQAVYPGFKIGPHHRKLANIFTDVIEGRKKRVIINIAPRHGKSEFASYLFPAYFLGRYPNKKIIMATHTAGLSEDYGRRVRNLIDSEEYREVFPHTMVAQDQKAAGKWSTSTGGQYYAAGVGGALAGRGADLFVIDDPHSEQDVKANSRLAFDTAWSWFQTGPLQRLMPNGAIIVVMTRWSLLDLTGRLLTYQMKNPQSVPWEIVELPAILPSGKALWPEQWPIELLESTKASLEPRYWNAQFMQQPTSDTSALIARKHWRVWPHNDPPKCEYILQSWDTAFETTNTADYSACTTWGVWYNEEEDNSPQIILLDAFKDRMDFPELKRVAFKHWKEWEPDTILVEKKAAGAPLIQELRATGIPVQEFSPSRGNDKMVRVSAVADLFTSGKVWAPDTRWAREVIEEIAAFPVGEHDDYVDTCLVGSTQIRMGDGYSKRLDSLVVGDIVATPIGPRRVSCSMYTGVKEVFAVCADGTQLLATADHLVHTQRGWIRVDKLRPLWDTVYLYQHEAQKCESNKLFSTVKNTVGILTVKVTRIVHTLVGQAQDCIGTCGRFITALSRRDTIYITSMATQVTTQSTTLSVSAHNSTGSSTNPTGFCGGSRKSSVPTWRAYDTKHPLGIALQKVLRGIRKMQWHPWLRHEQRYVSSVWLMFRVRVSGVVRRLLGKVSEKSSVALSARVRSQNSDVVLAVQSTHTMQKVFDITVEDAHCFYADGILVHNCTQALLRYRQGGFITLDTDEKEDTIFRRSRTAAYY